MSKKKNSCCHRKHQSFDVKTFSRNLAWCRALLYSALRHLSWEEWLQYISLYVWIGPSALHLLSYKCWYDHTWWWLIAQEYNRHHLIHNIHHWSLAKSLESCHHIIYCTPRFPCCLFVKEDKRQCLIITCEGVKCEKTLWLFFTNTTEHVVRWQLYFRYLPTPKLNLKLG